MADPRMFALQTSDLNAFLFADVGNELNGSPLTILSILARLGQDPWTEAARWASLSPAAATDCLAKSIAQMPLSPQAIASASATAAVLTRLLPLQGPMPYQNAGAMVGISSVPKWAPMVAIYGALVLGMGLNMMLMSHVAATPAEQITPETPRAPTSD